MEAESESYKRKQIDGQSIRNYTYKKSQNDKAEGVSNEYEPKHGEQTNGIQREETVVYTRDDRRVRGRGGPAGYRDDGRGKEKSDSFLRRTKEESAGFLRRTAEKGLRRKEVENIDPFAKSGGATGSVSRRQSIFPSGFFTRQTSEKHKK